MLGGPVGAVAGAVASVGLQQLGYGNNARPSGKASHNTDHIYIEHTNQRYEEDHHFYWQIIEVLILLSFNI